MQNLLITMTCRQSVELIDWTELGRHSPNVSTTPITAMGCRQCLHLSVLQLKVNIAENPIAAMGL